MIEPPSHRLDTARRVAERLEAAKSIAILTHVNGDGDGWGSACAIAHHLRPSGIDVRLLAATPYPERLRFLLPDALEPLRPDEAGFEALCSADAQVVIDASEPGRLGEFAAGVAPARTIIIDHHAVAAVRLEADLRFIDPHAAAAAELVYDVLTLTAFPIGLDVARAIYVGLVTDTGSFRYSNTSPHVHRLAADLLELGVEPERLYRHLFGNVTAREIGVVEATLANLQLDADIGLAWAALGADVEQLEEYELVIDHLRNIKGTRLAVLLRELEDGSVKISLRSNGPVDVAAIARAFGGGGHIKAAGASLPGPLDEAARRVVAACREALRSVSPLT